MKKQPVLVLLAAGMGSRYGGLKQIDPIDAAGNLIIDFSIYDAIRAGFHDLVFIIKHEIEQDFMDAIGSRISRRANVKCAFQEMNKLPHGLKAPEGRTKPLAPPMPCSVQETRSAADPSPSLIPTTTMALPLINSFTNSSPETRPQTSS